MMIIAQQHTVTSAVPPQLYPCTMAVLYVFVFLASCLVCGQTQETSLCPYWSKGLSLPTIGDSLGSKLIESAEQEGLADDLKGICPGFQDEDAIQLVEDSSWSLQTMFKESVDAAFAEDADMEDCEAADYAMADIEDLTATTIAYIEGKYEDIISSELADKMWHIFAFSDTGSIEEICLSDTVMQYCVGDYTFLWNTGVNAEDVLVQLGEDNEDMSDMVDFMITKCPDMSRAEAEYKFQAMFAKIQADTLSTASTVRASNSGAEECKILGLTLTEIDTKLWTELKEVMTDNSDMAWEEVDLVSMHNLYGEYDLCYVPETTTETTIPTTTEAEATTTTTEEPEPETEPAVEPVTEVEDDSLCSDFAEGQTAEQYHDAHYLSDTPSEKTSIVNVCGYSDSEAAEVYDYLMGNLKTSMADEIAKKRAAFTNMEECQLFEAALSDKTQEWIAQEATVKATYPELTDAQRATVTYFYMYSEETGGRGCGDYFNAGAGVSATLLVVVAGAVMLVY